MNKTKGITLTILSAIIFGFSFTLSPLTYGAGGSNPVTLTFLRSFMCLPVLFVVLKVKKISFKITKKEAFNLFILGLIGTAVTTLILNTSFAYVDVGIATTIHFVYPIFVTIGCVLFFKEHLSMKKLLALIIATLGICCFFGIDVGSNSANTPLGITFAILSGITYAFYIIFMDKSGLKNLNPFKTSFYVAVVVAFVIGIYGLTTKELTISTLTTQSWILTFIISILCSLVAVSLLQVGIKHIGASTAAILSTFEPITGVVCGAILLGEEFTALKILACVLIFTGVGILVLSKDKEKIESSNKVINHKEAISHH
ncbi:DMT family transporter [Clostridium tarantellae]|uniref:EamA family transporter n=1 Tax=Clostridium tarantellae TaxID=39493 RepID=A0A6I1MPM3_9CLOT|nr:DMT family transporter [Clostridium tarantellae]MPQ44753.1 EamA family transporter [Clostridium tarantellae]